MPRYESNLDGRLVARVGPVLINSAPDEAE